jgi:sulfate transport system substrate-binding protein
MMIGGCAPKNPAETNANSGTAATGAGTSGPKTLTLAAYTVPKEAYQKGIIPAFRAYWKKKTGQDVQFRESYEASGTQARNVVNGLEADIAALSLEGDIAKIQKAGLITVDWKQKPHGGMVTYSVVAIATREGNPKGIQDWADLAKPGIQVLTPNPKTSGGAKWNLLAVYGAGLGTAKDKAAAQKLLAGVQKNIAVMDKSGRESFGTFDHGIGDAAITYENEALRAMEEGRKYTLVRPASTILIENPAAVVDKNADKHGVRDVADAFVDFLFTAEAQRAFAKNHFRPVDETVAKEYTKDYPKPAGLFTVADLGGWEAVDKELFAENALWDQVVRGNQ